MPSRVHHALHTLAGENPHQVVFEGEEEARATCIALPPRAASKLVVDAPRFMALGADDSKTARIFHTLGVFPALGDEVVGFLPDSSIATLGVGQHVLRAVLEHLDSSEHFRIAPEHDIGASTGHVGGHRHCARRARLSNHIGFTLVLLGIENVVRDTLTIEEMCHRIRLLDARRTNEHRLPLLVGHFDLLAKRAELLALRLVDQILLVVANDRLVGRDDDHVELVDVVELGCLGVGGAGHAGQLLVEPEQVLE